ncbi:MAG TPA: Na+/H+ antiporter subunit C, partial [Alphaproteobacteria bacterium]|nr:Na+/H+ antiporter subunit C [Alphaproteobacteria bacterium]
MDLVATITANWNYLIVILLMMGGLFIVISQNNMVKKLVGLAIFQTSVFLFYITV